MEHWIQEIRIWHCESAADVLFWLFFLSLLAPVKPHLQAVKSHFGTSHFCFPLKSSGTKMTWMHHHTFYSSLLVGHLAEWTGTLQVERDKTQRTATLLYRLHFFLLFSTNQTFPFVTNSSKLGGINRNFWRSSIVSFCALRGVLSLLVLLAGYNITLLM